MYRTKDIRENVREKVEITKYNMNFYQKSLMKKRKIINNFN